MGYVVPNLSLIAQDNANACWYACALMLRNWRQATQALSAPGPSDFSYFANLHNTKSPVPWAQIRLLAQSMGLTVAPLMTPTEAQLEAWLRREGPLWLDGVPVSDDTGAPTGTGHVVVIGGIRRQNGEPQILIFNPWPPNVGNVGWFPITWLTGILSDGANNRRNAFFLYY